MKEASKILVIVGIVLTTIGLLFSYYPEKLKWVGRLPGDLSYDNENVKIYFPIATMLTLSIILSIVFWFYKKIN